MKKLMLILSLFYIFNSQAKLKNCNTCTGCSKKNQSCCFLVDCPEDCNSYTCNPYCPNVTNPKCIFDPATGKFRCICF